jgi:hypothetical protein
VFVLREAHRTFWTRTVWTDASSMKSFMLSGLYRQVMPSLFVWCDEASVADWIQDSLEPPSWEEVHRRMQHDGRRSKVNDPSEAHPASKFLLLFSGRLENCDSSDPMTAANAAAQRSLRADDRIGSFTNRRTPQ